MFTLLFIHLLCNSTLFPSFNNFRFHLFCLLASLNVCAVLPPTWCGWHLYCSNSVTLICEARSEWVNSFTYSKCHHTRVVFFICSAIYRYGYYLTIDCCFFRNKTKTRCHLWLCLCLNRSMRVLFIFYSKARKSFFFHFVLHILLLCLLCKYEEDFTHHWRISILYDAAT